MTKYLYRKLTQAVTLWAAIAVVSVSIQAQYRAVAPPERKTPRAVGVLETFKDGKRRLVPVTFYYEKRYYDAALYHATPVPFTLYSETVYEIEQYGKPLGTFTLQSATHSGGETSEVWFGNGKFKPVKDEAAEAKKVVVAPVVVSDDPSKPVLHRKPGSEGDTPVAKTKSEGAPAEEDDPDRPKLHKRADAGAKNEAGATPGGQVMATTGSAGASEEDADHPVLRRGKPVQEQSGKDLPEMKKEEPVSRMVAISDAAPSELQPLLYVGKEEERKRLEASARELAAAELRRLAGQRGLNWPGRAIAKKSAGPKTAFAKTAPQAKAEAEVTFADEQFVPYDLDYSNYATVVYSGRYTPQTADGAQAKSWVVTVVAREDEGNKLVKLYSAVSDPRELGLYPEVRLVDALDPDGYGRAALLFREKKRDGVSWMIGRVTGYEVQPLFETAAR